jgi:hypothetical protein
MVPQWAAVMSTLIIHKWLVRIGITLLVKVAMRYLFLCLEPTTAARKFPIGYQGQCRKKTLRQGDTHLSKKV